MSTPVVTSEVADRFEELRRRYLASRLSIAVLLAVSLFLFGWVAFAVGDYFWEWSLTVRRAALSGLIAACVVWLLSRCVVICRDTRQKDFAGLLERSFDGFGQRIRTVLDTVSGKVSGPDEMLSALGHQTLGRWETLAPARLIPRQGIATAAGLLLLGALCSGGLFSWGSDVRLAMNRALGMDVPYTLISVEPGDQRLLEGTPVEVSVELSGRTDRDVTLRYRQLPLPGETPSADAEAVTETDTVEAEWTESDLTPSTAAAADDRVAVFEAGLGKARAPIEYQFVTSIGTSDLYRIDVQPVIKVERTETLVQPPEYTRLDNRIFSGRDITVLEASRVVVSVKTTHPLHEAVLEVGPKRSRLKTVEIQAGDDRTQWTFELTAADALHWKFSGTGRDETPMTPVTGRLRIRRDGVPKISWHDPADELKVHTLAEVPMRVQFGDDYGLSEAGIVFQLGDDEDFVLAEWVPDDAESTSITRAKLEEILPLESFELTEQDFVSYYAYAVDNRGFGPQRHESDMRYIDIRPLRQLFREIEPMSGNGGNGRRNLRVGLDELISRQRFLINRTRRLVRSSTSGIAAKFGTIDRMVENQSDLATLVRFLADFLVQQGNDDVEALNQAEALMLQASDSLAAGSFDLALIQEKDAQLALAEARRTLEITLLKRMNRVQRQALMQFNRRFSQRLRRERPKTERQIVDSLNRIAAEQERLGKTVIAMNDMRATQSTSAERTEDTASGDEQNTLPVSDEADEAADNAADSAADADNRDSETTLEDRQEHIYQRQVDLLERLQTIAEQLEARLNDSQLMAERMDVATNDMDALATQAREREYSDYHVQAYGVADQLREMSLQLDALRNPEAVGRVSSIRDMTGTLVSMEYELSRRAGPAAEGQNNERSEELRLLNGLSARTKTIDDILSAGADVGDVEMSEVMDRLQTFAQETDFLNQLETTRAATGRLSAEDVALRDEAGANSTDALERALQYADAVQILEELYQELVTPRLTNLRRLESQASQLLCNCTGGAGGGSGGQAGGGEQEQQEEQDQQSGQQNDTEEMSEAELQLAIAALMNDLEENGMKDLAELLKEADSRTGDVRAMSRGPATKGNSTSQIADRRAQRITLLVTKLRDRIREAVLLEISADRDASVPVEYEYAVDGYLRSIAGERE